MSSVGVSVERDAGCIPLLFLRALDKACALHSSLSIVFSVPPYLQNVTPQARDASDQEVCPLTLCDLLQAEIIIHRIASGPPYARVLSCHAVWRTGKPEGV